VFKPQLQLLSDYRLPQKSVTLATYPTSEFTYA
jgi:hypothetical protein